MSQHPLEALLRPPVEYYSAITALTCGGMMAIAPERLMMLPSVGYVGGAALATLAYRRFRDGRRVRRYQKGLRKLPYWSLKPSEIPVSDRWLFMGNGFAWTGKHTQRLYDAMLPENTHFIQPSPLYQAARRLEVKQEKNPTYAAVLRALQAPKWGPFTNPVAPLPDIGGIPAVHGVGLLEGEGAIHQNLSERVAHTAVIGTTRVGKTRMAEVLINQDIRRGDCVIVIDPKGDAELLRSCYVAAKLAGREKDFHVLHLGFPEHSVRYNPVGDYGRITEVATRIARQLPGEGQSATFREFVWGYVNGIAKAMAMLGQRPNYRTIEATATNLEPLVNDLCLWLIERGLKEGSIQLPKDWRDAVRDYALGKRDDGKTWLMPVPRPMQERDREVVALTYLIQGELAKVPFLREFKGAALNLVAGTPGQALLDLFSFDPGYYAKLTASLLPFLAKLTTGKVAEILAPDYSDLKDDRPILEWMSFIRQNGIIYIGLDALSDPDVAAVVGSTMFSDLVSTLGRIYKKGYGAGMPDAGPIQRNIRLHADEFSDLIREDFIPLLNKGGGVGSAEKGGFSATVYTQTLSDIVARLGDKAKAGQTLGNLNTVVMLRVKEPDTAKYLTDQLPKVAVNSTMLVSAAQDVPDESAGVTFRSGQELRITQKDVPMLEISTLLNLPKGQAFVLKDGGQLSKIRLPMASNADVDVPASISGMVDAMREAYRSEAADDWLRVTPVWNQFYDQMRASEILAPGLSVPAARADSSSPHSDEVFG